MNAWGGSWGNAWGSSWGAAAPPTPSIFVGAMPVVQPVPPRLRQRYALSAEAIVTEIRTRLAEMVVRRDPVLRAILADDEELLVCLAAL